MCCIISSFPSLSLPSPVPSLQFERVPSMTAKSTHSEDEAQRTRSHLKAASDLQRRLWCVGMWVMVAARLPAGLLA